MLYFTYQKKKIQEGNTAYNHSGSCLPAAQLCPEIAHRVKRIIAVLSVVPECQNNESLVSCSVKNSLQVIMMSESSGCLFDSMSNITNFNSFH